MASITVSGLGSGLDINGMVTQLAAAEREAAEPRLDYKEAAITAEISAVGLLKSASSEFQSSLSSLSNARTFAPISLTSSNLDAVSATASSIAEPGSYSVEVSQLAQGHKLASVAFDEPTDTVGEGTLTFAFGRFEDGVFTDNSDTTPVNISISSADNSLQGIANAVNRADIGVSASLVNDGTGHRLVFSSIESGADYGMRITVVDKDGEDSDLAGLSQLAYDPEAGADLGRNMSETIKAQDAMLSVDGLAITRGSNSVAGVISGVTLELNQLTGDGPARLTVNTDTNAAMEKVTGFVDAYNGMAATFRELGKYDSESGQAGVLQGDSMLRNMQSQVQRLVSSSVPGTSGAYQSLMDVGITTGADGTLRLDNTKLGAALKDDVNAVARLFGMGGETDDPLIDYVRGGSGTEPGSYPITVSTLATQGGYSGADVAGFPLSIDSANDSFALELNGVVSSTITLSEGDYADGDALAEEISARINADGFLKSAGLSVNVAFVDGHIEINSNTYGSNSSVKLTSADSGMADTLGLGVSVGTATVGQDVAGTIGGIAAQGAGQILSGGGKLEGLQVEVQGGATGNRGGVDFSQGIAGRLYGLMNAYLDGDGLIQGRLDALDTEQEGIDQARTDLDTRVSELEERLNSKFTRLDGLLSQLTATGDFLTAQLDALSGKSD
ncbi:MAG: flagellar filament capping protein FliD [Gammaproteobacteria bacterium]